MHALDWVYVFIERFDQARIRYMVTGSVATVLYGEPRLTHDVDVVVWLAEQHLDALYTVFSEAEFYLPPKHILRVHLGRAQRGAFNIIHHATGFKADCYLVGRDPLHVWGFEQVREVFLGEAKKLILAPPEYVILRKLEFFREGGSEKHLHDIRGMLRQMPELKQSTILLDHLKARGLEEIWREI